MGRHVTATLARATVFSATVVFGIASAQSSPSSPDRQQAPATSDPAQQSGTPLADQQFVVQAAMANMAEIQLGHLAVKNAKDPSVKKFAQMMIDDHLKTQNALADAAYGTGIHWPTQLSDGHRQLQYRLSTLKNEQFDREYMKAMVDAHRDVEQVLAVRVDEGGANTEIQTRASRGAAKSDGASLAAKLNDWATRTLPSVRAHLKEAEQVYGQLAKAE